MAVQTTNIPGAFAPLMESFRNWREESRRRRDFRRTLTELNKLSDRELLDFGLSRHSLRDEAQKAVWG